MRIFVSSLALCSCVSTTPVRVVDAGLVVGDDAKVDAGLTDTVRLKRDTQLFIDRRGGRDHFEAPVTLHRRPGVLEVVEPFGRREYPDEVIDRVWIEDPDPVATGVVIGAGVALGIAAGAVWVCTLAHFGEM